MLICSARVHAKAYTGSLCHFHILYWEQSSTAHWAARPPTLLAESPMLTVTYQLEGWNFCTFNRKPSLFSSCKTQGCIEQRLPKILCSGKWLNIVSCTQGTFMCGWDTPFLSAYESRVMRGTVSMSIVARLIQQGRHVSAGCNITYLHWLWVQLLLGLWLLWLHN